MWQVVLVVQTTTHAHVCRVRIARIARMARTASRSRCPASLGSPINYWLWVYSHNNCIIPVGVIVRLQSSLNLMPCLAYT